MGDELIDALEHVFGKENVFVIDEKWTPPARFTNNDSGLPSKDEIEADLREYLGGENPPWLGEMAELMWTAGITRVDNPDDFEELMNIYDGNADGSTD